MDVHLGPNGRHSSRRGRAEPRDWVGLERRVKGDDGDSVGREENPPGVGVHDGEVTPRLGVRLNRVLPCLRKNLLRHCKLKVSGTSPLVSRPNHVGEETLESLRTGKPRSLQ